MLNQKISAFFLLIPNIKRKFDFILNRALIVFFFAILVIHASREVSDLDLWLHLKTGEFIVQNKTIPSTDIFSFALSSKPWINHEWLFQAVLYFFYSIASADGLIFLQNIIVIATFLLLLFMGIKEKNHLFVFSILYVALLTISYRFTIRPDIFSLFFLALYLFILKKFIENNSKSILFLPVLQILWTNIHGFFFIGPVLIVVFLIGELVKRCIKLPYNLSQVNRLNNAQISHLLGILLLTLVASFLTPFGLKGASYPISVLGQLSGKSKIFFQYIQELAKPINFNNILSFNLTLYYKAYIIISFFSFRINKKGFNISDLMLWLIFLGFSLMAIRNIAYFTIIATYVIFNNLTQTHKEVPFKFKSEKLKILAVYVAIGFLFYYPGKSALGYISAANYNFNTYTLKSTLWGISETRYPEKAVNFLLSDNFPKHMFNDFNSGAYLIGKTYPKRQVFIDGRTELYGPDFFTNYLDILSCKNGALEKAVLKYNIKGFFLTTSTESLHLKLLKYLLNSKDWKIVYFDESALIFLKNEKENENLIKKYGFVLENWNPPMPDFLKLGIAFRFPYTYLTRARMLSLLNYYEAAFREAEVVLDVMPNNAEALKYTAEHYFQQKNYKKAFEYIRNSLIYSGGDSNARCKLIKIYYFLKEKEKAMIVADAIIKKQPKFAEGYYTKAFILQETDKKIAKELITKAIKLSAQEPKYHILLGDLLLEEGKPSEATKEWEEASKCDPFNEEIKNKLLHF